MVSNLTVLGIGVYVCVLWCVRVCVCVCVGAVLQFYNLHLPPQEGGQK